MTPKQIKLRYDGRYTWIDGENRQWTIISSFIDPNGQERRGGSFSLEALKALGVVE